MSNSYYNHATYPTPNSPGSSAQLRAELESITAGFALLPTLASNGYKIAMINSAGTALTASSALQSLAITSSTINSTPIGASMPSAGTFTSLTVTGTASLGSTTVITGGTINSTPIGGTTPSTGAFTTVSASSGFAGALTGNVTGNLTGNVTGNVVGNLTGNVASSGTSTFAAITMSGAIVMSTSKITGLGNPTLAQDATTKTYVDTADALKLNLTGGNMSGAIAMGTSKITGVGDPTAAQDAATKNYTDTGLALKLNLVGGTMSGPIAMGTSKITDLGNPTQAQDAVTKTYVDTADALKLNLSGGTMSGAIAMGASKITGVGDPTAAQDVATKTYVDTADAFKLNLSGGTMSGAIAMGTSKITGLGDPIAAQDAATKNYVDNTAQGLDAKASCVVATIANITLSGIQTIDGVLLAVGDRVLVKDQSTQANNGIYLCAAGSWTRSTDTDTWTELVSAFTFIEKGTTNSESGWVCTVDQGGTIGTSAVTWVQFSGAGQITAGAGLTKTGNTLDVGTASSSRIVINADNIDLATTAVTAGTYQSLTVDTYGRVTAGSNPTTIAGYNISNAYTSTQIDAALALKLNLTGGIMSGAIAMSANKITGLGDPTFAQDAVTKTYVDTAYALKLNLAGGTMSGAIAMGTNKITGLGDPTLAQDATTKTYVDTADALKLNLAGGTMTGALAMGTSKITGLGNPTTAQDAATKTYVDTADALKLNLSGGTMSGAIALGANKITGLADPTAAQDATTKTYVDGILGSATAASTSAAAAAVSATNASNSATASATSAAASANSAASSLSSLNTFKGQYYGSLSSDPTLDPLGSAMTSGDLYFNTTIGYMKVYDGTTWLIAYLPATGYLALGGGTMTGSITFAGAQTWPTFNQNTSGTAAGLSATLAVASGGTGVTTSTGSGSNVLSISPTLVTPILGTPTSGNFSAGAFTWPTFNQNTTGTSSNVTGIISVANGGTGLATSPSNGMLDIGNGTGFTRTTLTAGSGVTITNSAGGITIAATGSGGTVTSVTGTAPIVSSGGTAPAISMAAATSSSSGYLTSTDWNTFNGKQAAGSYVSVGGALGTPSSGILTNCTFPTLNQNTTGTASNVTGIVAIANGGTGSTTAQGALNTFSGGVTSGSYLRGNGTNITLSSIQAGDVPTLNQNTTGTASNVTGTVAVSNGGSGTTTAQAAINTFAGGVTSGSYLRGNGTNVTLSAIQVGDVPTLNQNTTGTAANVTGTIAIANGGTGSTNASAARTALGATTLGANLFTITNPSAITFARFNADNTVSSLDAATFRTAIGAGTGSGSVTSITVTAGTGMSGGGTVSTSGTVTLTNSGVTSLFAGTGISVNASTGGVTVTNSGVTSVNGSTGAVTVASGTQAFVAFGATGGF